MGKSLPVARNFPFQIRVIGYGQLGDQNIICTGEMLRQRAGKLIFSRQVDETVAQIVGGTGECARRFQYMPFFGPEYLEYRHLYPTFERINIIVATAHLELPMLQNPASNYNVSRVCSPGTGPFWMENALWMEQPLGYRLAMRGAVWWQRDQHSHDRRRDHTHGQTDSDM